MKKAKEAKEAKEKKDMDESWQRALDDSIKFNNEQREHQEKINLARENFEWDCIKATAAKNREKEDRMIRIEAKLDELLKKQEEINRGRRNDP